MQGNEMLFGALTIVSAVMFVGSLIALPALVARLPVDYFTRQRDRSARGRRWAVHALLVVLRNAFGLVLLGAGVAMLVLPGQGLLAILVAIMLLDFPGKRRLERWLIRQPSVFRAANWIRRKRNRPPLGIPEG